MGNAQDNNKSCEKPMAVVNPMPAVIATAEDVTLEQEQEERINVSLHLFHYRQQMNMKNHQLVKWATSKLLLTEELLKQHQCKSIDEPLDLDSDAAWAEQQLNMLTDDEDDSDDENKPPSDMRLGNELSNLIRYRSKLRKTILHVAQEKLKKREKTKLKRLKRRTLISSKKPSNKDKHRT